MSQLKAFVGHSFVDEDKEVVTSFLDFFDHVKKLDIGFDWENAKPAEPKALAEKVLTIIQDKNLFIGICTKKELVIEPAKLKQTRLSKKILRAQAGEFLWKTSDWIIQEISLCIGRGMEIVLLVEEGLRQPGGLQGDLEYIAFSRSSPEKSFNKILEMIKALIPKVGGMMKEQIEPSSKAGMEEEKEKGEKGSDWLEPKGDWSRVRYEIALMHMVGRGDQEGQEKVSSSYLLTTEGQREENKLAWGGMHEYLKIWLGKGGSLKKLESLAKTHPGNSEITGYLGKAFRVYDEHGKAAAMFRNAAANESDANKKFAWLGEAAISFSRAGNVEDEYLTIKEMRANLNDIADGEMVILITLRDIAEREKDKDMYFACSEKLLDLRPDKVDIRFRLAYEYSEEGREDLALFHYTRIPYQERDAATWNNIGVANARLDLDNKAVEAYRKAEELGETLAMSNLARKLINAGFLTEAEQTCERAIKIENYDKQVGSTISRIKEVQTEESKKEDKILGNTKQYREFYREYGGACAKPLATDHKGTWQGPRCVLTLEIKQGKLMAEGSYEITESASMRGMAAALAGWSTALQTPKISKYTVRYKGSLTGLAVRGQIAIEGDENAAKTTSLLTAIPASKEVLMVISDELNEIRVYEKDAPEGQRFYPLKRVA